VTVLLEEDNRGGTLRPGMNATVEIEAGVLEGVLNVPLPAVKRRGEKHFVWKLTPRGPEATEVSLGGNNTTHVEILAGLAEGDRIKLVQPAGKELPADRKEGEGPAEASSAGVPLPSSAERSAPGNTVGVLDGR
jgi:multidrug efflux pump subunit AcrA (membrane-fusion protein)